MRYLLCLLTSLVVAGAAAAGVPRAATLVIVDQADGSVSVYLTVVSPHLPAAEQAEQLRNALVDAFAPLPDRVFPNLAPGVWSFSFSIPEPMGDRSIDLTAILARLKTANQHTLRVTVMLPDVVGMECNLPPVAARMPGTRWYEDEFPTDDPAEEIVLTFAPPPPPREPGDPAWLLGLLAVPLPIFAWAWLVRRRAARTHDDGTPLAASYWRFHQLYWLPTIVLWLAAFSLVDVGPFVAGWFPGDTAGVRLLRWTALYALPPAVIALLAQAIARPALTKLQSLGWPGVDIYRQAASLHLLPHAALLCGVCGVATFYETGNIYTGVALPFIGLIVYFVYGWLLRRAMVLIPNAISTGELQDRVTELARQFRVAVPLVSMLSSGRTGVANAFAVPGKGVWLSESLLRNFSRKEVDAIVAHELAHFRQFGRRHSATQRGTAFWLFYVMLVVGAMMWLLSNPAFAYGTGSRPMDFSRWIPLGIGLLLVGIRLTVSSTKRYNEYEADLHAVEVTGEPAALITALTRLHRIGGTPLSYTRFEECFYTHPATTRRVAALARRGGLRRAEVAELVKDTEAVGDRYAVPATAIEGGLVFSSAFRSSYMNRMSWTITGIAVVLPIIAVLLAQGLSETITAQATVLAGGVVATIVAYFVYVRQFRAAGQARLRRGLREKLRAEAGDPKIAGGMFVNFAPGDVPKLYECFGQWDVGYLFLSDRLVYIGEQVRLALRPDQITDLRRCQGLPGWRRRDHVYLTWRDPATSRAGTFRLWPGEISSDGYATDIHRFEERLHAWRAGKVSGPTPDAFAAAGPPELGDVHGVRPKTVGKVRSFLYSVMFLEVLAAGICLLLGLSFDLGEPAGAWYVLAVMAVVLVINILPYWLAREPEPPAVTAAPATP